MYGIYTGYDMRIRWDWKLISATCVYARFAPPAVNDFFTVMASRVAVGDCISILHDLWDSEEFKINTDVSSFLKTTVDKICSEGNEMFERCFEEVTEAKRREG